MGARRGEIRHERLARRIPESGNFPADFFHQPARGPIGLRIPIPVFRIGEKAGAERGIVPEIAAQSLQKPIRSVGLFRKKMTHRGQGIGDNAQSVDQASACIVTGSGMFGIAHVASAFHSAEQQGGERRRPASDRAGAEIGRLLHLRKNGGKADGKTRSRDPGTAPPGGCTRVPASLCRSSGRKKRAAVVQSQFQDLRKIQPAVGGVAVFLSGDQRFLTARNRPGRKILLPDPLPAQKTEHHIVVEQRRCGVPRREKQFPPSRQTDSSRRVPVNFDRKRGLRLVGTVEGLQKQTCHRSGPVVPFRIASAQQNVLGDRPPARPHHEERKQMTQKSNGLLGIRLLPVRLEQTVQIPRRERIRIRRLLQTHRLPEQHKRLQRLMKIFRSPSGTFRQFSAIRRRRSSSPGIFVRSFRRCSASSA